MQWRDFAFNLLCPLAEGRKDELRSGPCFLVLEQIYWTYKFEIMFLILRVSPAVRIHAHSCNLDVAIRMPTCAAESCLLFEPGFPLSFISELKSRFVCHLMPSRPKPQLNLASAEGRKISKGPLKDPIHSRYL